GDLVHDLVRTMRSVDLVDDSAANVQDPVGISAVGNGDGDAPVSVEGLRFVAGVARAYEDVIVLHDSPPWQAVRRTIGHDGGDVHVVGAIEQLPNLSCQWFVAASCVYLRRVFCGHAGTGASVSRSIPRRARA